MQNIFVFTELENALYVGTNTSDPKNGLLTDITIPSKLIIPSYYDKKPVEYIGYSAFYQCLEIEEVEIRARVKAIHKTAFFGCQNLKYINIPSTCTFLGESAIDGRINQTFGSGPMTYVFERFSTIQFIDNAALSNFRNIIIYIFDLVDIQCVSYFLGGTYQTKIYSPYFFKFCGVQTTLLRPRTCHQCFSLDRLRVSSNFFILLFK